MLTDHRTPQEAGEARPTRRRRLRHRSMIVLAVALPTYAVARASASLPMLALFAAVVAVSLFAYLVGRGDDRFAALYSAAMGIGAAGIAGLLAWLA